MVSIGYIGEEVLKPLPNNAKFPHFKILFKRKTQLFADIEELGQSTLLLQSLDDLMTEMLITIRTITKTAMVSLQSSNRLF